jgi:hypothetical protein
VDVERSLLPATGRSGSTQKISIGVVELLWAMM